MKNIVVAFGVITGVALFFVIDAVFVMAAFALMHMAIEIIPAFGFVDALSITAGIWLLSVFRIAIIRSVVRDAINESISVLMEGTQDDFLK